MPKISFERAKSTCELIQNLFNFHLLYPPVRDNGNEYILNDLEGQIYLNENEMMSQELFSEIIESSNSLDNLPNAQQSIINAFTQSNKQLTAILNSQSQAIKALVERFYSWDVTSLQLYKDKINRDNLVTNQEILWNAAKLNSIEFSKEQLNVIYSSGRFDYTDQFLMELQENIDWSAISKNPNILWDKKLLDYYKDKLNWSNLISTSNFKWNSENLKSYVSSFDNNAKYALSTSGNVEWTLELINEFADIWNWHRLSQNIHIKWSEDLFVKYIHRWDYYYLSTNTAFCWSQSIIERYESKWSFFDLSKNEGVPWNEYLIRKYIQKINPNNLFRNSGVYWTESMLENLTELLDKAVTQFTSGSQVTGWHLISIADGHWKTKDILERYEHKLFWWCICENRNTKWDNYLINRFSDKIFCRYNMYWGSNMGLSRLCRNQSFPWTLNLIEKHEKEIERAYGLRDVFCNPNLLITLDFIRKYKDKLDFGSLINNPNLFLTSEILDEFKEKAWSWKGISGSSNVLWNSEILNKYKKLDWNEIAKNQSVYQKIIKPIVNRPILDLIMNEQFA